MDLIRMDLVKTTSSIIFRFRFGGILMVNYFGGDFLME